MQVSCIKGLFNIDVGASIFLSAPPAVIWAIANIGVFIKGSIRYYQYTSYMLVIFNSVFQTDNTCIF